MGPFLIRDPNDNSSELLFNESRAKGVEKMKDLRANENFSFVSLLLAVRFSFSRKTFLALAIQLNFFYFAVVSGEDVAYYVVGSNSWAFRYQSVFDKADGIASAPFCEKFNNARPLSNKLIYSLWVYVAREIELIYREIPHVGFAVRLLVLIYWNQSNARFLLWVYYTQK